MKRVLFISFALMVLLAGLGTGVFAQVTVTAAGGGTNLVADKAANAASPAYTTLGNIVLTEATKGAFSAGGTLILTAPSGWEFSSPGSVTTAVTGGTGGQNVAVTGVSVSTSAITLTLTVNGTNKTDILTITGVQVRSTNGATLPASGNILRTVSNPGTATISGITNGSTNFGSLSQIVGAAAQVGITTQPSAAATAGAAFAQQPSIAVRDQFGNVRNAANGAADNTTSITATRSAGSGTLQGTTTATASNGTATFLNLSHTVANTITIAFSASGLTSATSNNVVVSPAAASKLVFVQQPMATTAGVTITPSPTVRLQDAYSNDVSSAGVSVTMTISTGTGTLAGTTSRSTNGSGLVTFDDLSITASGTKNLTAAASGLTSAISSAFDINASSATQIAFVQQPTSTSAGSTISPSPTVQLNDQYGNSAASSGVSISVALTSGTGALSGTMNRTTDASGLATFDDLAVDLEGSKQLTATSSGLTSSVSSSFTISAASPAALAIVQQPTNANAGAPVSPSITVQLKDGFGNSVSTSGVTVAMALSSGSGTLSGTTARVTNASGIAAFDDLNVNLSGAKVLTASSSGLTPIATNSFTIAPLGASKLAFFVQPSAAAVNDTIAPPVVVQVQDGFGNGVDTNGITITLSLTTGTGTLGGTASQASDSGLATFDDLSLNLIGDKRVTASASGLTSAESDLFSIAASGTATKLAFVQEPTNAVAGETLAPSVTVQLKDESDFNVASSGVSITLALSSGTGSLSGTLTRVTNSGGVATFDDLSVNLIGPKVLTASSSGLIDTTSQSFTIMHAAADQLAIVQQPTTTASGAIVSPSVTAQLRDAFGNDVDSSGVSVTIALTSGAGTLSGTTSRTTNGSGVATFDDLSIDVAGSKTLTVSGSGLTSDASDAFTISPGAFSKLQLLVPGESASPGSGSGKTGSPTDRTAGSSFVVTVNAVDAFWNVVNTVSHTVSVTSNDANAVLPSNAALVGGTKTFSVTLQTAGTATMTTTDVDSGAVTPNTSPSVNVLPGAFSKLQLLLPGETAAPGTASGKSGTPSAQTAGAAFNVTVNAVDAQWNLVNTVTDIAGITSNDVNATLPSDALLVAGSKIFSVTLRSAGTSTITASDVSDGSKSLNTSPSVSVAAGSFSKLQLLLPGETAVPGSSTGKTGAPSAQTIGIEFSVIVNAVDANWNLVSSADVVSITSSDGTASLPSNAALVTGTQTYLLTFNTAGTQTVTSTDVTNGSITANTSPSITVNASGTGSVTAATGGSSISADNVGGSYTSLTGPVYSEATSGNAGAGTIILQAPTGFEFDVNTPYPTVLITRIGGGGSDARNINDLASGSSVVTNVTSSAITFTVTAASTNGVTNSLTWQDVRVRPTAGTPLASGDITKSGTSTMTGVTAGSTSFGTLTEVAGATTKLVITLPGQTFSSGSGNSGSPSAQTAGSNFALTSISATDQYQNVTTSYGGIKTISYAGPAGDGTYTTAVSFTNGQSTTTLTTNLKRAETTTLTADDGTINGPASSSLTVNTGAFSKMQILVPGESAAPGTATGKSGSASTQSVGAAFNVTANAVDAHWNLVTSATDVVGIASSDVGADLPSNAALVGGTKTFSVTLNTSGSQNVTANDITQPGMTPNTSASISVSAGAFTKLQILLPGESAAPGTPTGKTGTPTARTAGTAFSVTVNAVDANWNPITSATDVVGISSSDVYAVLPSNAALVAGSKTFSVTLKTAGSATVTATDITDGSKTLNTSPSTTVNAGAFTKLQVILPGETTVPGSASGKTGTPTAQTAGTGFTFTVRAVDAQWNLVNSIADVVSITSSDGAATLPSNAALVSGTQTFSVTINTSGTRTVTASDVSDGGKTPNTSSSITVNAAGTGTVTPATGGTSVSSDNVGGSYVSLTGPVYSESTSGNVTAGTIILTLPSGFEYDTGGSTPTVLVTRLAGTGGDELNVNDVPSGTSINIDNITTTQVTFTVTGVTDFGVKNSLTWQGLRIRPTSGTPLAGGNITMDESSTSTMTGVTEASTNFATLTQVAGAAVDIFVTLPGETFTAGSGNSGTVTAQAAGSVFTIPGLTAADQYKNIVTSYSGTKTISYSGPTGDASYTTGVSFTSGQSTTSLSTNLKKAQSTTITADDGTISGPASTLLSVNPGAFTKLQVLAPGETANPGSASGKTGSPSTQAVTIPFNVTVNAVDANWNVVNTAHAVQITSSDGAANLPSNDALVAGTKIFSVTLNTSGTQTVTASDVDSVAVTAGTSASISVSAGAFTKLQLLLPGETADPGSPTGKTGTPNAITAGSAVNVTVNAVDANWNVVSDVTDVVGISTTDVNASLPANAALVGGTKTFSVTLKTAGTATLTASDIGDNTKTANTSPSTTVNAGAFTKLQILVPGESASPGSATGKTGSPSSTTEATSFNVTVRSVDANWNLVSSTDVIGMSSSDGTATLPANAALVAGSQTFSVTLNTAGSQTVTATDITDGGKSPNTSSSITVNAAGTIQSVAGGGLWSSTTTWVGGVVPGATSNVVIATTGGNAVMIDASVTMRTLTVNTGAILAGDGSAWTLTVGKSNSTSLDNSGTINANGTTIALATSQTWVGAGDFNLYSIGMGGKTLTISFAAPDTISLAAPGIPITGGGTIIPGSNCTFDFNGTSAQTIPIGTYTFNSLAVNNAAGATLAAAVTTANVTGDILVQSGTFVNGGFAIVGNGTKTFEISNGAAFALTGTSAIPSGFGTTSFGPTSTVDYQGTSQTIAAANYGNLTLTGGTKTFTTTGSIGIAGSLTLVSSPTVTTTSSTLVYNGAGSQTISNAIAYSTLSVAGSGTKTLGGNVTIDADLTVTSGALNLSTFTANRSTSGGTLTVSSGATLQVGGTTGGAGASNYPTNFTTQTLDGTVDFNGGTGQVIPTGVPMTDLVVSAAGTRTIAGNITLAGSITVSAGTLDLGTFTLNRATSGGSIVVSSGAALVLSGTTGGIGNSNFPSNYTTITLSGTIEFAASSGTQDIPSSVTYTHLTFSNGGIKQIIANSTASGNTLVNAGAQLDILNGVVFAIGGDFDISGTVNNAGTVNLP